MTQVHSNARGSPESIYEQDTLEYRKVTADVTALGLRQVQVTL